VTQTLVNSLHQMNFPGGALAFRLDGAIEHLLLDEFQDTSLGQWRVLKPIARGITQATTERRQSFFCVGDVKQGIYGWRGGMAGIFSTLPDALGPLQERALLESRRSAQPIIDVVNQVFSGLGEFQAGEKNRDGLSTWGRRFETHTTFKKEEPGYVGLHTGPAQNGQRVDDQRGRHCAYVATKIRDLAHQAPGASLGVLCRKNDTVARLIFELRQRGVEASEEGGNPLTDSPAVELILSLLALADHPGHSVAWFHLLNSPLHEYLNSYTNADAVSRHLRRELLTSGYGSFTRSWAKRLISACARRDLSRLQQLVEMAYAYEARSTLRADDFVSWARKQRVPDPSGAKVRVMTIHSAKGLEFDTVVLPELDACLAGQRPAFVVRRDAKALDVNFVCRYANETVQQLLTEEERLAFAEDRQQNVEESLSLLYVAMTRAIHALHLFLPGPREGKSVRKDAWYNLLRQTLAPVTPWTENALLFEQGDANWFQHLAAAGATKEMTRPVSSGPIQFSTEEAPRRRGREHVAPSRTEGNGRVVLDRLFHPSSGTGPAAGTLYHAWFATIGWLEDGPPTEAVLRAAAEKIRKDLPTLNWSELDDLLATFRGWLRNADITSVLRRSAYAGPEQAGFPAALAVFWTKAMGPLKVEQERRFLVCDGVQFWNGSLDRIVWLGEGDHLVAADVLDFKTDAIAPDAPEALAARIKHYRPQLEAYRRAVAILGRLPEDRVATRLVFTSAGKVAAV
jgi:ATP-dependent helicase/nuclease subunit A